VTTPPDDTPPEVLETEPVPRPGAAGAFDPAAAAALGARLRGRRRVAWTIAIASDALQIGIIPVFGGGFLSPFSDVLDVVVGSAMIWLLGWHFAFLPSFAVKLLPIVDIVPTWTMAVWLVTRKPVPGSPARGAH
jgi:hypothetical protein